MSDFEIQQIIHLLKKYRDRTITYSQAVKLLDLVCALQGELYEEIEEPESAPELE